jgi:hypothetical protein
LTIVSIATTHRAALIRQVEMRFGGIARMACSRLQDAQPHLYAIVGRQPLGNEGWEQNVGFAESLDDLGFHVCHL